MAFEFEPTNAAQLMTIGIALRVHQFVTTSIVRYAPTEAATVHGEEGASRPLHRAVAHT